MTPQFEALIEAAKQQEQTPQQRESQRRSFAFGNTAYENQNITKEMVDQQAEKMAADKDE